ncbi:MAG: acyltransferase family protein [Rhodobacteraceae bacterium]|nr:acyltransferase family protein [Paracoccaceae bacterium]
MRVEFQRPKARFLTEIEVGKGIGITLVVVGHLVAVSTFGPDWYAALKRLIYQFHMPLFMYLSGFSFAWIRPFNLGIPFVTFLKKRASRLLIPFAVFGAIIILAKYGAQFIVFVDNAPDSLGAGFVALVIDTEKSPALSIWYVFVLFVFSVMTFLVRDLTNKRIFGLLALSLVMHFSKVPDILYLNRVFYFFLFFVLGLLVARNYDTLVGILKRFGLIGVIAFLIGGGIVLSMNRISGETKLITGLLSLPAIHYISLTLTGPIAKMFEWIGGYSFPIYLMNTLTIGGFKALYIILMSSMTTFFPLYLLGATVFGLLLPIGLYNVTYRILPGVAKFLK